MSQPYTVTTTNFSGSHAVRRCQSCGHELVFVRETRSAPAASGVASFGMAMMEEHWRVIYDQADRIKRRALWEAR
jgi:hypothetical protein